MVTYLLSRLGFSLAVSSLSVLLLCAGTVQASVVPSPVSLTVPVAEGLEIDLPSSLSLEVITPEHSLSDPVITSPVITGKVNGEPGYFIAATKIKTWEKNSVLWNRLESGIRNRTSAGKFTISQRGSFSIPIDKAVWFRAYEFQTANQAHKQVYFLLNERRNTYWITLTVVDGVDLDLAIPITKSILGRARIVE